MSNIIITTKEELSNTLEAVLINFEKKKSFQSPPKLYTINQIAKMLGKAHATISKLVKSGIIKSTKSGLITETAVNEYLNNE